MSDFEVVDNYKLLDDSYLEDAPMQDSFSTKEALGFAGTNGDPLKAIQTLAGVTSSGNDSGELIIHGSKPRETLITIDHLPIGYVFHLGGLYSVISPEATRQIDAYLGGFDVSYETMGAVIDVTPKYPYGSGNGRVHLGLYDADFALDIPLSEKISLFIGGRRSYFDLFADKLLDELAKNEDDEEEKLTFTLFPRFYDAQMNLAYELDSNNLITLEAIISKDELKLNSSLKKDTDPVANGQIDQERGFETVGLRWRYTGEKQKSQTLLYHLRSYFDMQLFDSDFDINVVTYTSGLFHETIWNLEGHQPVLGFEHIHNESPIDVYSPRQPERDDPASSYLTDQEVIQVKDRFISNSDVLYFQDTWNFLPNWKMRNGIRVGTTEFQGFEGYFDHRHALIYEISEDRSLSFAGGKYSQFPEARYVIGNLGNPEIDTYEHSYHYTFNYTQKSDFGDFKIEPYYKTLHNLVIADDYDIYSSSGEGFARGVDFTYEFKSDEVALILAYTFVDSERELNAQENELHRFYGEIPHTLQINGSYKFKNGWRIAGLFKYSSGSPYTKIENVVDLIDEESGEVVLRDDGESFKKPIYSENLFGESLPYTMDIDLQIGKEWNYGNGKSFEFSVELLNISTLFKDNIRGIRYNDDYEEDGYYYQMPFLPAFHMTYRF